MVYDLSIALRVSPHLNKKHIYFNSKYDLVKTCFESFIVALDGVDYELFVILDGCPKSFEKIFRAYVEGKRLRIVNLDSVGNSATFMSQIFLLSNIASSEYVYFAEDDYFYLDHVKGMLELIARKSFVDFVSPYDHPDYYFSKDVHPYKIFSFEYGGRMWKNVLSTCCTFLTRRKTLKETCELLKSYRRVGDHLMWYLVTRKVPLKSLIKINPHPRYLLKTMSLLNYMQKSSGKRAYLLWAPEPTIATHMQKGCLSPKIDWSKYFSDKHGQFKTANPSIE